MIDVEKYLDTFFKGTRNPTLKAMQFFMDEYNWFEKDMKFIHIAGTNGKGSTTKIITNILMEAGYKVGTFISPHLVRYNERIRVNNIEITDEEISGYIEELEPKIQKYNEFAKKEGMNPVTYFELITTMALLHYYRNNVDFVVLETGLGGLYDCTNVITMPIASVITSIGMDHMQILGDTLEEIAFQKAGIIKPNSETVIFNQSENINKVFIDKCNQESNKLHIVKNEDINNYSYDEDYQYFDFKDYKGLKINLRGKAQIRNTALSLEVIDIIKSQGFEVSGEAVKKGISTVVNHGRMEILNKDPIIIFDGAHNIPAMENMMEMINMYYPDTNKRYIISILERKEFDTMLSVLSKDDKAHFILTSGNDENRFAHKETLYDCAKRYISEDRLEKKELEEALKETLEDKELTFVIGSFYVYGTVVESIDKFLKKE